MRRFLAYWFVLGSTLTVASLLISFVSFRHVDLRFDALLLYVLASAAQALVLARQHALPRRASLASVVRDTQGHPLARTLVLMDVALLAAGWLAFRQSLFGFAGVASLQLTWIGSKSLAAALFFGAALKNDGARRLNLSRGPRIWMCILIVMLCGAAADRFVPWLAPLPAAIGPGVPKIVAWPAIYGVLLAAALMILLKVSRALGRDAPTSSAYLEAASAALVAAATVVALNVFLHPYLNEPWSAIAKTCASIAASCCALAAILTTAPRAHAGAPKAADAVRAAGGLAAILVLARDLFLAILACVALAPLWFLPDRGAGALGRGYAWIVCCLWPRGRRVGMINLRRAFGPEMTEARARRAAFDVFGNLGRSIAESIRFGRRFKRDVADWERWYRPADPELEARIIADPRPKIFVTAHLGSWETAIMLCGLRVGDNGGAVARRIDNAFLDAIVRRVRMRAPGQWIDKRGAVFEALTRLRNGQNVAMLLDENAGYSGVFVEFFGRPASTGRSAALLSLLTGAPLVLGAALRQPTDDRLLFKLAVIEPTGSGGPAVTQLTQQIAATFERWIREDPLQWRWIHWRWKTRPDGSEETYTRADLRDCFRASASRANAPTDRERTADAS